MHQFHEFNNFPHFGTYCTIGANVTNQREVCMGVLGVYTVLGETTRNPTNTMVKPLDSNVQLQLLSTRQRVDYSKV